MNLWCYFIAVAVILSPMAHSTLMNSIDDVHNEISHSHEGGHPSKNDRSCHHGDSSLGAATVNLSSVDCDHGDQLACKVLCVSSTVAIPEAASSQLSEAIADFWLEMSAGHISPPPLSSLYKPPRV